MSKYCNPSHAVYHGFMQHGINCGWIFPQQATLIMSMERLLLPPMLWWFCLVLQRNPCIFGQVAALYCHKTNECTAQVFMGIPAPTLAAGTHVKCSLPCDEAPCSRHSLLKVTNFQNKMSTARLPVHPTTV